MRYDLDCILALSFVYGTWGVLLGRYLGFRSIFHLMIPTSMHIVLDFVSIASKLQVAIHTKQTSLDDDKSCARGCFPQSRYSCARVRQDEGMRFQSRDICEKMSLWIKATEWKITKLG
jgi:hypothetical protein